MHSACHTRAHTHTHKRNHSPSHSLTYIVLVVVVFLVAVAVYIYYDGTVAAAIANGTLRTHDDADDFEVASANCEISYAPLPLRLCVSVCACVCCTVNHTMALLWLTSVRRWHVGGRRDCVCLWRIWAVSITIACNIRCGICGVKLHGFGNLYTHICIDIIDSNVEACCKKCFKNSLKHTHTHTYTEIYAYA